MPDPLVLPTPPGSSNDVALPAKPVWVNPCTPPEPSVYDPVIWPLLLIPEAVVAASVGTSIVV